jgi:Lipid A 3-O-deacylase (PagL)
MTHASVSGLRPAVAVGLALASSSVTKLAVAHSADAESMCDDCGVLLGVGGTFDLSGSTHGLVVPLTVVWRENRYELGLFRVATTQDFVDRDTHTRQLGADPYWGVSATRRWTLVRRARWQFFFGFGASYKTDSDELSASHLNFAEQLGVQIGRPATSGAIELCVRHWSNAGIKLPNRGENFVTLSYAF